jgi:hypothetical protein
VTPVKTGSYTVPDDRVGGIGRQDPLRGDIDDVLTLEPEETEVVDALPKVQLDDNTSANR